jgi:tetratricopeptide (TPR) repeat protein
MHIYLFQALKYLQQAIKLKKDLDDKVLLGNMYFQEANHYKDLKQYNQALEVNTGKSLQRSQTI